MGGLPGSGKSYFASHLADETGFDYLSSDKIRKQRMASGKYRYEDKLAIYVAMAVMAEIALRENHAVIIDATFTHQETRSLFSNLAEKLNVPCKIILVHADEETVKKRLSKRREDSEANYDVYKLLKSQYEPLREDHLQLQSEDFPLMYRKALTYLMKDE